MAKKNKPETAADRVKQLQNNYVDLTKTGPLTYRELAYLMGDNRPYTPSNSIVAANQPRPILENLINSDKGVQYIRSDYGNSMFDPEGYATEGQLEQLNDIRAENQPWYAQIGAGLAKGVVLAGTTFLDGTLGLILGGTEAIAKGDVSRLWDNDFSRAMQSVNEWSEEVMPNYYSREELEEPWYKNIFTANWLGDKFLKNLGFSVGAIYSGGVYTAGLKALKIPSLIGKVLKSTAAPKIVQSAVGATLSAVNEGRIEALNNSNDWQDLKMQELDDLWRKEINKKYAGTIQSLTDEYYRTLAEFENTGDLNKKAQAMALGARLQQVQEQASAEFENRNSDQRYRNIAGRIAEDRLKMGNMDLLMNIPILTASNVVQFTKYYARGFNTARKAGITGSMATGYAGREFSKLGAGVAIAKAGLSEGTEEISQKAASLVSGNYYSTDVNNYRKSQFDKNASQETLDWVKAFATGINETVNDASSWEEFTIGALTGFMGVPMFRGFKSADGKVQSPIYLEGGAREAYRNYKKDIERSQEIANYLNSRVQSPEFQNYYRGLVRHNKYQNDMNQAAMDDDEFNYKNAEYAQFVSDINMFDNAGRLEDLKDYISNMYDVSDEELEAIIDKTTSKDADGKSIGPFIDKNGNRLTSTEEGKQEMKDKLTKEKDSMLKTINNYRKTKDNLDVITGGTLTDDQLSELTWMNSQIDNWNERVGEMIPLVRRAITDLITNRRQDMSQIITELTKEGKDTSEMSKKNTTFLTRLETLSRMSDKQLKNVLTNPKNKSFVESLANQMDIFGSQTIGAIDTTSIKNILRDIPKIGEGIKLYNEKLAEYLKTPAKLAADQAATDEKAAEEFKNKAKQSFREKAVAAKNIAEFKQAYDEEQDEEVKTGVLKDLITEGNEIAKNYKDVSQYDSEINNALDSSGENPSIIEDAKALWLNHVKEAENLETVGNPNSVYINDDQSFLTDSEGDIDLASNRFQNARYALLQAMSKVNNDIKFRDRFKPEYKVPVDESLRGKDNITKETTGDSQTPTLPGGNTGAPKTGTNAPVGNISAEEVVAENADNNKRRTDSRVVAGKGQNQKKFYRPTIPELHIEASKEGDFRPFDVVVAEREPGKDFSEIYNYLRDNGAFDYVNSGKLKAGQTLLFMIDPEFEASVEGKPWHTAPTVFLTTEDGQIVGSLDEGSSIASFEGLEGLVQKVRDEYQTSRSSTTTKKLVSTQSYTGSKGRVRTSEVHEVSRTTDREGTVVVELKEVITSDSEKQSLVGREISSGGLEISLDSDIVDWKRQASGGRREDGSVITPEEVTAEEEQEAKEQMSTLLENTSGQTQPFYASTVYYAKDGRIIARDKKGNTIYLKSDPIGSQDTSRTATARFYATPKTKVSKIMVGKVPYSSEERSLADIPGVADNGRQPIFGIIRNGVLYTNNKVSDSLIIKPVDMSNKEGRLYLLIPNAAGTFSPVAVRVKHFNPTEFNIEDATVASTLIGTKINEVITKLAESANDEDVTLAFKELNKVIYSGDLHIDFFSSERGEGIRIVRVERDNEGNEVYTTDEKGNRIRKEDKRIIYFSNVKGAVNIDGMGYTYESAKDLGMDLSVFMTPKDINVIRKEITNALFSYNLPLQMSIYGINKPGYNIRAINSNILTSNLQEAKVIDSWFTTDYFDAEGNLQRAVNPPSVKPDPNSKPEQVVQGTKVTVQGTSYIVDLKRNIIIDEKTKARIDFNAISSKTIVDIAWAQDLYGDNTESSIMTDNKIITPEGRVLDRSTGKYLPNEEAQKIKGIIEGRNRELQARIALANKIVSKINENQKRVDKSRTDSTNYYIQEDDGQYHKYDRVHSRLGDNWLGKKTESENSRRALEAGTAIDKVIRDFFTSNTTPVRPDILSEEAFSTLISRLTEIKSNMEQMGETFLTNNIVLFHKYANGSRVAGEVDILSVDKNGNFKIYDVKTSRYSFSDRYFNEKSSMQRMSTKDYYTLQLSAYQNLFESQYGVRPTRLAILPFVLTHGTTQAAAVDIPSGTQTKLGLPIDSNQSYFRADRKVDDNEARFVSSEKDGKVYFKPILDTKAHEATLRSTDAAKLAVEFIGGDPKEASSFVLVEPGEATRNSENGRLMISKKAKVFAVTPSTPYSGTRNVVTSITHEQGIPITYNPAVNVPLESRASAPVTPSNLPIFDSTIETMNPENRVLPENAFEEEGEVGYYEIGDKVYKGYLRKVGDIEATTESGQKVTLPIYTTKIRDHGFGREGELGSTSQYLTVFSNGKAIAMLSGNLNNNNDGFKQAQDILMKGLSTNPAKVLALSSEQTQISAFQKPGNEGGSEPESTGGAAEANQITENINTQDDEFEDDLELRRIDENERPIWDEKKELSWLKKVLPQLSEQDRVKVVKGLIQVAKNGAVAWGMVSNGIMTLSDIAAEGTAYHEAFHVVFHYMLTPQERAALFEEASQIYGIKSQRDLEEDMAEGFREYVTSQERRGLGRRILDFFRNLFAKVTNWKYMKPSLTAYYQAITQGKYKRSDLNITNTRNLRQEEYTPEMQSIKDKAKADGTFMKAPNGNPTNLNERQWLQVRTKAFKDWFGDWINNPEEASKVVDENGEPLVVYHGGTKDITIFKHGTKDNSNTGIGYYTDNKTGEKIPLDSERTIFFSDNRFVGESYRDMLGIKYYNDLYNKVQSLIGTFANGRASFSREVFKSREQLLETLEQLSEFNPRFLKLKSFMEDIKGKRRMTEKEANAARELFIETRTLVKPFTEHWLMNRSDWQNSLSMGESIIKKYSSIHNAEKLKNGEIPSELKRIYDIYKKREANRTKNNLYEISNYDKANVSLVSKDHTYITIEYDGESVYFNNNGKIINLDSLSTEQISKYFDNLKSANKASQNYYSQKEEIKNKGDVYEVFLNIKNPLSYDYEGTAQGQGFKENPRIPFGYVAARQVDKAIKEHNDGIIYENVKDPYYANNYGVFNANQIKSATSNTGEFSSNNDDIRFRTVDDNSKVMKRESQRFLDNFGITIKEVEEFGGKEKLFDALNRVINVRNADDISEGVGEAIAFMMQHNDTMETLIKYKLQEVPKSIRRSIRKRGDFDALASTKHLDNEERQKYVKEIGKEIATELRKLYRVEPINVKPKTFLSKLWEIITEFFDKLTPSAKTKFNILRNYTKNIANSVKLNDPSIVLTTDYKPGTTEKAARVDIGKALRENPYERRIIEYLNSKNIALAGSASIALEGTLYRPSENPLHDIDFNAARYSKEELDNVVKEHFPHSTFVREITDGKDKITETYLVLDRPFATRKPTPGIAGIELYDKETGKKLGSYVGSELFLEKGVQGKFLDFFLGEGNNRYPYKVHNIDGKSYLVSDFRNAFSAKIEWARPKDIWDYNRFNTEERLNRVTERKEQERNRIKEKLESARIIWGHPAIGKTTYLERNQDILEWDQEVNDKRNEFFRDQIDPEHKLDPSSKEYKQLRSQYMSEWREHPEYVKFLTDEWEKLKERARRENKRLFASPAPLLEIGADDFDLYVNIPEKSFLERNIGRGGTPLGSMGWKQIVNDALVRVDPDKIVTTDKYFSEFMRDNLGVQWGTLTSEEARELEKNGWTKEQFERISQPERERAVKCAVL